MASRGSSPLLFNQAMAIHGNKNNDSRLRQRLITAAWGVPVATAIIWLGEPWFTIMVALCGLLGAMEFYRMVASKGPPLTYPGLLGTLLFIISPHFDYSRVTPPLLTSAIILSLIWLILGRRQREEAFAGWVWTLAGMLYVGWLLSHMVALRGLGAGRDWVYLTLFSTFASDSAAFFVGSAWGRHRLAPIISPQKTWEGAIAGVAAAMSVSVVSAVLFCLPLNYGLASFLGLLVSLFGQLGDLAKSLLKRNVGIKDSGTVMPGHGGMLDRMDSVLFASPLVYYFVLCIAAG